MNKNKKGLSGVNSLALTLGLTGLVVVGGLLMVFNESNSRRSIAQIEESSNEAVLGVSDDMVSDSMLLNKADFNNLWRVSAAKGNVASRIFKETGSYGSRAVIDVQGGSPTDGPSEASIFVPYELPTKQNYAVSVKVSVNAAPVEDDETWATLVTNQQSTTGNYMFSIMPKNKAFKISKFDGTVPRVWVSSKSKAINGVNSENNLKIVKNVTTGKMIFYINGVKVFENVDKGGYLGGNNRLFVSSYSDYGSVKFSNLLVYKQ